MERLGKRCARFCMSIFDSLDPRSKVNTYKYTALGPGEIRVLDLELLANDEPRSAPIKCFLRHVVLNDSGNMAARRLKVSRENPTYEAVSYVWGVESHVRPINLDGKQLHVTRNLEEALREFRGHGSRKYTAANGARPFKPRRTLWIDAICINQADFAERAEQVKLMGSVYLNSTRLLIWLGARTLKQKYDTPLLEIIRLANERFENEAQIDQIKDNLITNVTLASLLHLMTRPWFNRSWILQEVVLGHSDETLFHYGDTTFLAGNTIRLLNELFDPFWRMSSDKSRVNDPVDQYVVAMERATLLFISATYLQWKESVLPTADVIQTQGNDTHHHYQPRDEENTDLSIQPREADESTSVLAKKPGVTASSVGKRTIGGPLQPINRTIPPWIRRTELDEDSIKISEDPRRKSHQHLEYWLSLNRDSGATNQRDKIYSVLGILAYVTGENLRNAINLDALIIDDNAEVQDVFSSAVKAIVTATGRLDILGYCAQNSLLVTRTWTPDWTVEGQKSYTFNTTGIPTPFTASANRTCQASFSDTLEIMTVKGIIWDEVFKHNRLEYYTWGLPGSSPPIAPEDWITVVEKAAYGSLEATKLAFLRTILTATEYFMRDDEVEVTREEFFANADMQALCNDLSSDTQDWPSNHLAAFWKHDMLQFMLGDQQRHDKTLVVTNNGWLGKTEYADRIQEGDVICVLLGCPVPMVLRPVDGHFEVIGDIFIDGIMFGEAIQALEEGKVELVDLELH